MLVIVLFTKFVEMVQFFYVTDFLPASYLPKPEKGFCLMTTKNSVHGKTRVSNANEVYSVKENENKKMKKMSSRQPEGSPKVLANIELCLEVFMCF